MRDVIYRDELYDRLRALLAVQKQITPQDVAEAFRSIPSADPPEIVRCKVCRIRINDEKVGIRWCPFINQITDDDFFCKYGKRKDEKNDS